jgi:hypothetical protein
MNMTASHIETRRRVNNVRSGKFLFQITPQQVHCLNRWLSERNAICHAAEMLGTQIMLPHFGQDVALPTFRRLPAH